MTTKNLFPSLSEDGWVNDSIKTADYLLSHFFISEDSQSYIYNDNISSLPWIILDCQGDINKLLNKTKIVLSDYFGKYFNNVEVEVLEIIDKEKTSKGQISIYVKFTDEQNIEYSLGKILEITNLTISKIIDINNG